MEENDARTLVYVLALVISVAGLHCLLVFTRRYLLRPMWHRMLAVLPPYG